MSSAIITEFSFVLAALVILSSLASLLTSTRNIVNGNQDGSNKVYTLSVAYIVALVVSMVVMFVIAEMSLGNGNIVNMIVTVVVIAVQLILALSLFLKSGTIQDKSLRDQSYASFGILILSILAGSAFMIFQHREMLSNIYTEAFKTTAKSKLFDGAPRVAM